MRYYLYADNNCWAESGDAEDVIRKAHLISLECHPAFWYMDAFRQYVDGFGSTLTEDMKDIERFMPKPSDLEIVRAILYTYDETLYEFTGADEIDGSPTWKWIGEGKNPLRMEYTSKLKIKVREDGKVFEWDAE